MIEKMPNDLDEDHCIKNSVDKRNKKKIRYIKNLKKLSLEKMFGFKEQQDLNTLPDSQILMNENLTLNVDGNKTVEEDMSQAELHTKV